MNKIQYGRDNSRYPGNGYIRNADCIAQFNYNDLCLTSFYHWPYAMCVDSIGDTLVAVWRVKNKDGIVREYGDLYSWEIHGIPDFKEPEKYLQ